MQKVKLQKCNEYKMFNSIRKVVSFRSFYSFYLFNLFSCNFDMKCNYFLVKSKLKFMSERPHAITTRKRKEKICSCKYIYEKWLFFFASFRLRFEFKWIVGFENVFFVCTLSNSCEYIFMHCGYIYMDNSVGFLIAHVPYAVVDHRPACKAGKTTLFIYDIPKCVWKP